MKVSHSAFHANSDHPANRFFTARRYFGGALLILMVFQVLPYLISYEQSHILIHDNLDANLVWYTNLVDSGLVFAPNDAVVQQVMGGVPRGTLPSEFSFTMLWFSLLRPLDAYILERAIQALVAFVGMYLLLCRHIIPGDRYSGIHVGVALTYGMLPFWPFGGLSVAGLPLVLDAFLRLRENKRTWDIWLILLLFPFYASLILSGVFFIILIGLIILYNLFTQKRFKWAMVSGLALLCFSFLFTHYRLVWSFIFETDYVSHRTEMIFTGTLTLQETLQFGREMFFLGQYHAHSLHTLVILPLVIYTGVVVREHQRYARIFAIILLFIVITSLWYRLWQWEAIAGVIERVFATIPLVLGRFHYLQPMFWYSLFGISLVVVKNRLKVGPTIVIVAIFTQVMFVSINYGPLARSNTPSFRAFFAEEQFTEIQSFIGQPVEDYRVASIGIHPSIALYNGFYTLDGYIVDYPLSYKQAFGEIIAPELAKNEALEQYFYEWGSRAYIFVDQLGQNYYNYQGNTTVLTDLDLNLEAFWDLGGRYILSAVRIDTERNDGYSLLNTFHHPESAWDIYIYEIVRP